MGAVVDGPRVASPYGTTPEGGQRPPYGDSPPLGVNPFGVAPSGRRTAISGVRVLFLSIRNKSIPSVWHTRNLSPSLSVPASHRVLPSHPSVTVMAHGSDGPVKWSHFLTGRDDATVWNVSFLSTPAEWHAVAVGVLAVFAPDVFMSVAPAELQTLFTGLPFVGLGAAYSAGRGLRKYADTLHFRDALREPAYTVLGVTVASVVVTAAQYAPV